MDYAEKTPPVRGLAGRRSAGVLRRVRWASSRLQPGSPQASGSVAAEAPDASPNAAAIPVRPRLLTELDRGRKCRMQAVIGPAGWGKTTLVRQWVDRLGPEVPVAWLRVERSDVAPHVLGPRILAALTRLAPDGTPPPSRAAGTPTPTADAPSVRRVVDELAQQPEPAILIVDDVHHLRTRPSARLVAAILDRAPTSLHVVLVGRRLPSGVLPEAAARDLPAVIGPERLRLTEAETVENVQAIAGGGGAVAAAIHRHTEGWPTGVAFATNAIRNTAGLDPLVSGRPGNAPLFDFLSREVMDGFTPAVRKFLLDTCVAAGDFTVSWAQEMSGRHDARAILNALVRDAMFVSAGAGPGPRFHYQPQFAEFLRRRLEIERPARVEMLHRRALAWYVGHGRVSEAFWHAMEAGDADEALSLLEKHWMRLAMSGGQELERWIERLERTEDVQRVTLAFVRGWLAGLHGSRPDLHRAIADLRAADTEPIAGGPGTPQASVALLQAAFVDADPQTGAANARAAIADLNARDGIWFAVAHGLLGHHLFWADDVEGAQEALREATRDVRPGPFTGSILILAHGLLALLADRQRNVMTARRESETALAIAADYGTPGAAQIVPALVARAFVNAGSGKPESSTETLEQARSLADVDGSGRFRALYLLAAARIRQLAGDRVAARALFDRATLMIDEVHGGAYLESECGLVSRLLRLRPRRTFALPDEPTDRESRVLDLLAAGLSRSEIARELGVTVDTVKSHVRNLYSKLDAGTREEAVRSARERGLLRHDVAVRRPPPRQHRPRQRLTPTTG